MEERTINYGDKFKEDTPLTNLVMVMGFKNTPESIKQQLRQFMNSEHQCWLIDFRFQAIVDSLLEILWRLQLIPTRFKHHSPDIKLNARRKQTYCELCGQRNELAEYLYRLDNDLQEASDKQKTKLQLSHRYYAHHRPRNNDSRTWNPFYKSDLQSKDQFEKELQRLQFHVAGAMEHKSVLGDKELKSLSAEELIDEAAVRLTGAGTLLGTDDEGKLRDIARCMVDSRLTDRKKRILILKQRLNQTQITERLTTLEGRTISSQAISKTLQLINADFQI